ncbi:MAG TPA: aminotransferase class V-fold PLP-dependent enzyme [Spirochaetia bacterium]|nr:aminotransferase class V-fold PLP-dependent enzyme [Spirochaetia bacterium]
MRRCDGRPECGAQTFSGPEPTCAFTLDGIPPRRICEELDRQGICASDGNYYALEVTTRLGLEASGGMVRVGAVHYNTLGEVEQLVTALERLRN